MAGNDPKQPFGKSVSSDAIAMQKASFLVHLLLLVAIFNAAMASDLPDCDPHPVAVERVPPEYPIVESLYPVEGYAVVAYTILESGEVEGVELVESGSEPSHDGFVRGFGRSAVRAISQWRYERRQQACRSLQKFTFKIEE